MKKVLFAGIVIGTFTLTSCRRDYTCTFTNYLVGSPMEFKDVKRSDVKDLKTMCNNNHGVWRKMK